MNNPPKWFKPAAGAKHLESRSCDEILRELALARMIERGLEDVDLGRTVSHEEVRREVEFLPYPKAECVEPRG